MQYFADCTRLVRKNPPEEELPIPALLPAMSSIISRHIRNITELEATVRVLAYVVSILPDLADDVSVQLQRSIQDHPTVTDILLVLKMTSPHNP